MSLNMINLMLNNLGLSLKDGAGILMIGNLWRAPIIEIVTDWIGNEIERVAFGVATLVMKSSQGLDPWIDRSESLLHPMTRSQNPWTIGVRTVEMEGVCEPLRTPSTMTEGEKRGDRPGKIVFSQEEKLDDKEGTWEPVEETFLQQTQSEN